MVQLKTKPLEGFLNWILEFFETMLGDISFLKFVAEDQAFPGKAQVRAGCWRVSPLQGGSTSNQSPGPKSKHLQDAPLKSKVKHHQRG